MGETLRPVNPDLSPSTSGMWIELMGDGVLGVFKVRGLGALVLRAGFNTADPKGKMVFRGLSTFTTNEIQRESAHHDE